MLMPGLVYIVFGSLRIACLTFGTLPTDVLDFVLLCNGSALNLLLQISYSLGNHTHQHYT